MLAVTVLSMSPIMVRANQYNGSYLDVWMNSWGMKVAELHISAADADNSGTTTYVTVVSQLSDAGGDVVDSLPIGGQLFNVVLNSIGNAVASNPDGSYDFFALQMPPASANLGWFYGGQYPHGVNISWYPIPIRFFELAPGYYELIFN
jgi:hypothetical protein